MDEMGEMEHQSEEGCSHLFQGSVSFSETS